MKSNIPENYEHLEGKIIEFRTIKNARVVGCDRDVGISIVTEDDSVLEKGEECACLHGKSSPHRKLYESQQPNYAKQYDFAFDVLVSEIEDGKITSYLDELLENERGYMFGGSMSCAFS